MTTAKTTYHRDGTVTYWSIYRQEWVSRAAYITDEELAAMSPGERDKATRHMQEKDDTDESV